MFVQLTPSPVIHRSCADVARAPLPEALSARQGHLAACESEQRELSRLRTALDGIGRQARLSGPDFAEAHGWADSAQTHLDRARRAIEAEEFEDMPAHVATIRFRMNLLRNFLVRTGALDRAETAPDAGSPRLTDHFSAPAREAGSEPPSARAGKHKVTPAQFLRSGIVRIAHAMTCVPQLVRRHAPGQIQREKIGKMMERDLALMPLREELRQLELDLTLADLRTSLILGVSGQADRRTWARQTLGPLLADAQRAAAEGSRALKSSRHPQKDIEASIATIRSDLTSFNTALETRDLSSMNFGFLNRPCPTPSA